MSGFVYKWTDSTNGKMYIGSHRGHIDDGYVGCGIYFARAYKSRPESFSREILYVGDKYREEEERILLELDCANSKDYYNLKNSSVGGDTYSFASDDIKKKIAHGKNHSASWHNIKDKESWLINIRKSQECLKLRAGRRERMLGKKLSLKYDLDEVWLNIKDLYLQGVSYNEIKSITGYSRGTIYRAKKKNE